MLRNLASALLVLAVVSQVEAAGPVKLVLAPVDSKSSADGSLRFTNGKPTDEICHFHLSIAGLTPDASYNLNVSGNDGTWSLYGICADENGSLTIRGTAPNRMLSATKVELTDPGSIIDGVLRVVMIGAKQ